MNLRTSHFALWLLALLLLPMLCAAQAPAPWKPDPKLLAQLDKEVRIGEYRIHPPLGYAPTFMHRGTVSTFGWRGILQKDDISSFSSLTILPVPDGQPSQTLQQTMQSTQKALKISYPDRVFDNSEAGVINSIPFMRTHWNGRYHSGPAAQGIVYVGTSGRTIFIIEMEDSVPESVNILPVMEASALTFRKG